MNYNCEENWMKKRRYFFRKKVVADTKLNNKIVYVWKCLSWLKSLHNVWPLNWALLKRKWKKWVWWCHNSKYFWCVGHWIQIWLKGQSCCQPEDNSRYEIDFLGKLALRSNSTLISSLLHLFSILLVSISVGLMENCSVRIVVNWWELFHFCIWVMKKTVKL